MKNEHRLPPFLTGKSNTEKPKLIEKWILWKYDDDFGIPMKVWIEKQLQELVEADEKNEVASEFEMSAELLTNKGARRVLRKILKVFE